MLQWGQPQHVFRLIQHGMKHSTYTKSSLRVFGCLVHFLNRCHRHKRAFCESTYHSMCMNVQPWLAHGPHTYPTAVRALTYLHSYMYMETTSQRQNASSRSLPRCTARHSGSSLQLLTCSLDHVSIYVLILSQIDPRLHSFPATLTSLVPRQASPTRTYVRRHARTQV